MTQPQVRKSVPVGGSQGPGPEWGAEDSVSGAKSGREAGVGLVTTVVRTLALSEPESPPRVSVDR